MGFITQQELDSLSHSVHGTHVSLYMPTVKAGKETRQNAVRLKNLISRARQELSQHDLKDEEIDALLRPVVEYASEPGTKRWQEEGLAMFLSGDTFHVYQLPVSVEELVVVAQRYHLTPLLDTTLTEGAYFVLALELGGVNLYEGGRYSLTEVELPGAPESLEDTLRFDDPERQIQSHTRIPAREGGLQAYFHGQGVGTDEFKKNVTRYLRDVDHSVHERLHGRHLPLVPAGVSYLVSAFKDVTRYPHVTAKSVDTNPGALRREALLEAAWQCVEPELQARRAQAVEQFQTLSDTSRTTRKLEDILPASVESRIDTLFVRSDRHRWGRYNEEDGTIIEHKERESGDVDLVDMAAVQTLVHGGSVYTRDASRVSEDAPAAAIFRY